MLADAHLHFDDLARLEPDLPARWARGGFLAVTSCHASAELERTRALMAGTAPYLVSFGIHPQLAVMDEADALARLCAGGKLSAIGECGFDFWGDSPGTTRGPATEAAQREAFEFQLELAERHGLPLVVHERRGRDLLFAYSRRLAGLKAVVLHSWGGPAAEARDLLGRGVRAFFAFGAAILNGSRKARECCTSLPGDAILLETDAPWQPPRAAPEPGAPRIRDHSTFEDLRLVRDEAARLRDLPPGELEELCYRNFTEVFGHAL